MGPRDDLTARAVAWFAANGVGATSLRTLAAGIGTSHRMVNYHFGSREGLLAAVVEQVERAEREALERFRTATGDPWEAAGRFWEHVVSTADVFAPLYFELSSQAMRNRAFAAPLCHWLAEGWLEPLTETFAAAGGPAPAPRNWRDLRLRSRADCCSTSPSPTIAPPSMPRRSTSPTSSALFPVRGS